MELGTGILTWNAGERRSDRYGSVWLMNDGHTSETEGEPQHLLDISACKDVVGKRGRLVAMVVSPRKSTHIGDLFRGLFPSIPDTGEEITLGDGTAFLEKTDLYFAFGLSPDDGRDHDWLNPANLYRAHEQLVTLCFIPAAKAAQ